MRAHRSHQRTALLAAIVLALLGVLLAGCSSVAELPPSTSAPVLAPAPVLAHAPAPQLLLLSDDTLRIPAPPALESPQLKLEMAELQALRRSLTQAQRTAVQAWDGNAVVRWNEIARQVVARTQADPLTASRAYVLLSLAQYNALQHADTNQRHFDRHMPGVAQSGISPLVSSNAPGSYPSDHAAVAAASAAILTELFPIESPYIQAQRAEHQESRLWAGVNCRSDIDAGVALGQQIAQKLLERSNADILAASSAWDGQIPTGQGIWFSSLQPPMAPLSPHWGTLHPWLMDRPDQFRAPPPPAFGSPSFRAALDEVRHISDTRTPEQLRIAKLWEDGRGSATPPGHWNQIAIDLFAEHRLSQREVARALVVLNMALMDAGISSWDAKYTYWLLRPSQADPLIKPAVPLPNFPAYTSGHAAFSGAAAAFLAALFPEKQGELQAMAEQAALSRVYGGIHYRFDGEQGLIAGQAVGRLAATRMHELP
ncbi:MAG: phosphatase PAP2 family protein [Roseiflexaceae bacterium]|nr:phosphatase PAP2 family protein [Roseiflexaceae bacterium]